MVDFEWVRGKPLGQGTFSTVNLVTTSSSHQIAVKTSTQPDTSHLNNEKNVLHNLGPHPNIIRCLGSDQYNLFLEYAPEGTLADRLRKCNKLPEKEVQIYTKSILQGLAHVHRKGFAHCDIKLQNLLVFGDTNVKIADFGLAKRNGERKNCNTNNNGGELRGTLLYMSPESVTRSEFEAPGDIWAVGCAVVEMVSGWGVWEGEEKKMEDNLVSLLLRIGVGDEVPGVPEEVSELGKDFVRMCFVKDPERRWTAEMLLGHPWLGDVENGSGSSSGSGSPRCVFEFPEECGRSRCEVAEFDWVVGEGLGVKERLGRLVGDRRWECVDSNDWVIVRE